MLQLTVGFIICMYILGAIFEETGIVPNTRLERQEQARIDNGE